MNLPQEHYRTPGGSSDNIRFAYLPLQARSIFRTARSPGSPFLCCAARQCRRGRTEKRDNRHARKQKDFVESNILFENKTFKSSYFKRLYGGLTPPIYGHS